MWVVCYGTHGGLRTTVRSSLFPPCRDGACWVPGFCCAASTQLRHPELPTSFGLHLHLTVQVLGLQAHIRDLVYSRDWTWVITHESMILSTLRRIYYKFINILKFIPKNKCQELKKMYEEQLEILCLAIPTYSLRWWKAGSMLLTAYENQYNRTHIPETPSI